MNDTRLRDAWYRKRTAYYMLRDKVLWPYCCGKPWNSQVWWVRKRSTRCCIVCLLNCLTAVTLCNSFSFVRVLYCTVNGNENTTLDKQLKQLKKQSEQHTSSATIVRVFLPDCRNLVLQLPRTAEPDCRNLQKTFNSSTSHVKGRC